MSLPIIYSPPIKRRTEEVLSPTRETDIFSDDEELASFPEGGLLSPTKIKSPTNSFTENKRERNKIIEDSIIFSESDSAKDDKGDNKRENKEQIFSDEEDDEDLKEIPRGGIISPDNLLSPGREDKESSSKKMDQEESSSEESDSSDAGVVVGKGGKVRPRQILSPTRQFRKSSTRKTFTWDGSFLGHFVSKRRLVDWEFIYQSTRYCQVRIVDENGGKSVAICKMRVSRDNLLPCIVDEIKPLFGLEKSGTHFVTIGRNSTIYILTKSYLPVDKAGIWIGGLQDDYILRDLVKAEKNHRKKGSAEKSENEEESEFNLSDIHSDEFMRQVQKILVFRSIIGAGKCNNSGVYVRIIDGEPTCLSIDEKKIDPVNPKSTAITDTILKAWFSDGGVNKKDVLEQIDDKISGLLHEMLEIDDDDEEEEDVVLANLKIGIDTIINKIDKSYIGISSKIRNNIMDKLQS